MIVSKPPQVLWIPQARCAAWMAGMDLPWPHRALVMWQPLESNGDGPGTLLRQAVWQALSREEALVGLPILADTQPVGLFGWLFGQPRRAEFTMDWRCTFTAFDALLNESLYFAVAFDASTPRPDAKSLGVWHDQGNPPATLFPVGQRAVLRSGVDNFCLGVFCRDDAELAAFRMAISDVLSLGGGTLTDAPEPPHQSS